MLFGLFFALLLKHAFDTLMSDDAVVVAHTKMEIQYLMDCFSRPGIDVGGGWRTGCGSHPPSAERVEELEESVWSDVRQLGE